MSGKRHRPQRTCLGCGARDDQKTLIRLAVSAEGNLVVAGQVRGRGGYLHRAMECWKGLLKRKSLYRAFRAEIDRNKREKLVQELMERRWE